MIQQKEEKEEQNNEETEEECETNLSTTPGDELPISIKEFRTAQELSGEEDPLLFEELDSAKYAELDKDKEYKQKKKLLRRKMKTLKMMMIQKMMKTLKTTTP